MLVESDDRFADPHAFLIGTPKAGTTWLASTLSQHPEIALSNPKEPNIIATHKGTFTRSEENPDWDYYDSCFEDEGLRLDASIHSFACPEAPRRISERFENPLFILSLREPVARTFSHWRMIVDTGEAEKNGTDWSDFEVAWKDDRLRCDTMYGSSMRRWLEFFPLSSFFIIGSDAMRSRPIEILREIESFLDLNNHDYDTNMDRHSNSANRRRPISKLGILVRHVFSLIPRFIKGPIVRILQKRDLNIYSAPILSRKVPRLSPQEKHYRLCMPEITKEMDLLTELTGFGTSDWATFPEFSEPTTKNQD